LSNPPFDRNIILGESKGLGKGVSLEVANLLLNLGWELVKEFFGV